MSAIEEHEFEVWQGDEMVAAASSGNRLSALREAAHYVAVYSQDGPCEVVEVTREPISVEREILYADLAIRQPTNATTPPHKDKTNG